jgi:hypothetical protein
LPQEGQAGEASARDHYSG